MGEGFEILVWLGLMALLAIRGAAQNRKRAEREVADEPEPLAGGPAPDRLAGDRGGTASTPEPSTGAPRGILERMMDYAAEIERGARAPQAGAEAREGTVVVPGRRVRPSLPAERPSAPPVTPAREEVLGERLEVLDVAESDYSRRPRRFEASRLQAGGPLPRTPISETPEEPVRRPRRPGLERLDRYSTLKRAIVLSEILGRPPGLEGAAPIERQWSKD